MTEGFSAATKLAACAVLLAALSACASEKEPPPGQPAFYDSMARADTEVNAMVAASMISGYRQNNGLAPVVVDPTLMRVAQEQARAMVARDKLDHNAGRELPLKLRGSGINGKVAVENVSAGYHTLAEAFSGWRDSPPHRANMLKTGVSRLGIAAVYAPKSKYKVFWTLILAPADGGAS